MLTRIIMSVGYIAYVKSVFRKCRRNICAVLTETNTTKVKPGLGKSATAQTISKI